MAELHIWLLRCWMDYSSIIWFFCGTAETSFHLEFHYLACLYQCHHLYPNLSLLTSTILSSGFNHHYSNAVSIYISSLSRSFSMDLLQFFGVKWFGWNILFTAVLVFSASCTDCKFQDGELMMFELDIWGETCYNILTSLMQISTIGFIRNLS